MSVKPYVYEKRLLKLADRLAILPHPRFNYEQWVGKDWQGKQDLSCNTTGCALGWAATMKEFRRLGLRLHKFNYSDYYGNNITWGFCSIQENPDPWDQTMANRLSFEAARSIFGLTDEEAEYIFQPRTRLYNPNEGLIGTSPNEEASPLEVSNHIKAFVNYKRKLRKSKLPLV